MSQQSLSDRIDSFLKDLKPRFQRDLPDYRVERGEVYGQPAIIFLATTNPPDGDQATKMHGYVLMAAAEGLPSMARFV